MGIDSKASVIEANPTQRVELPEKRSLDAHLVRDWLREHEVGFGNALKEYADQLGDRSGYETFHLPSGEFNNVFTGSKLCLRASAAMLDALKNKFGEDADVKVITNRVESKHRPCLKGLTHVRLSFQGNDGNKYFIDPTYGQIDRRINRIILDDMGKEREYYGDLTEEVDSTGTSQFFHQQMKDALLTNKPSEYFPNDKPEGYAKISEVLDNPLIV